MVEVESRGWTSYVVSCLYPVAKDIVVRTRSDKVDKIRKVLVEELMAHAPDAPELVNLAREYGADRDRFKKEASFCVLCGLCVRYCDEVKKKNAVSFFDNGAVRQIKFVAEIAKNECWDCQECFAICPTSYAQAAYLLTEALAFPGQRKTAKRAAKATAKPRVIIPITAVPMTA
jgi:predicted molibdopterin-dependent oxidoreductase YjgC